MNTKIKISFLTLVFLIIALLSVCLVFALPTVTVNLGGNLNYSSPYKEIIVNTNSSSLGTVSGQGVFTVGETVTLSATENSGNFIAWTTSNDINNMKILSTNSNYTFTLKDNSPTTYYALFNSTTSSNQISGLQYTFYNEAKLASITDVTDLSVVSGDYTIPSEIQNGSETYKVFDIAANAFYNNTNLTSIVIPDGVKSIGLQAFYGCRNLESVQIPEGVESIGKSAFKNCYNLTSVVIPEGTTSLGEEIFYDCRAITSITLPDGLTTIGSKAFSHCENLVTLRIPEGVTTIESYVFANCTSLEELTLSKTVNTIKDYNLDTPLTSLKSIVVEEGNTTYYMDELGVALLTYDNEFVYFVGGNESVTSYEIPAEVTEILKNSFYNCPNLVSLTIPSTVKTVRAASFVTAPNVEYVYYDSKSLITEGSLSAVFHRDFGSSSGFEVEIGPNVIRIVGYFLSNNTKLTKVTFAENCKIDQIGSNAFAWCSNLTSIDIPQTVTTLNSNAFQNCTSLSEITINGNITSLKTNVFSGCTALTKLTLGPNVTSFLTTFFTGSNQLTRLNTIVVEGTGINGLSLPTYATWYKDGLEVSSINGVGTYTTTAPTT